MKSGLEIVQTKWQRSVVSAVGRRPCFDRGSLLSGPRQERTHATYKTYSFEPLLLHFQVELAYDMSQRFFLRTSNKFATFAVVFSEQAKNKKNGTQRIFRAGTV